MLVRPVCSQKLAVFRLANFLTVSLAFITENVPHANKKGKANSRAALGSLDWNLKLSGMRLILSYLLDWKIILLLWTEAQRSPSCGCSWISIRVPGLWQLEERRDSPGACMPLPCKAHLEWSSLPQCGPWYATWHCYHSKPFRWWCGACSFSADLPFFPTSPSFRKLKWYSCVIPPSSCPSISSAFLGVLWGGSPAQRVRDCPPFLGAPVVSVSPKLLAGWSPRKCYTDLCSTKLLNFSGRQELEDEGKQALLL